MDFFTVPTLTFGVLYCFFVIGHERRKILHFNVTRNPHALWVVQQLREAWAYKQPHRFLLFDRDAKFGADVVPAEQHLGIEFMTAAKGETREDRSQQLVIRLPKTSESVEKLRSEHDFICRDYPLSC